MRRDPSSRERRSALSGMSAVAHLAGMLLLLWSAESCFGGGCGPLATDPRACDESDRQLFFAEAVIDGAGFYGVGTLVSLDGSRSTSGVAYQWEFVNKPAGSNAILSDATAPMTSFTPDIGGDYLVKLTVDLTTGFPGSVEATVRALEVVSLDPDQGPEGTTVILHGTFYDPPTGPSTAAVSFGGVAANVLYVTDTTIAVLAPPGGVTGPVVYAQGSIQTSGPVFTFTPPAGGMVSTVAGSGINGFMDGAAGTAEFSGPSAVALDGSGNVLVADQDNHRIRRIDGVTGAVTTLAGNGAQGYADGPASAAEFNYPSGVAVDTASRDVYVADLFNHRIRKIDGATGEVSTLAGSGAPGFVDGSGLASAFNQPLAVAVDPTTGDVLVVDLANHSIRRVTSGGVVSTVAGTGSPGFNDGAGGVAQFDNPQGVAVSATGIVYVGDALNQRIRAIDGAGFVSTLAGTGVPGDGDGPSATATLDGPAGLALDATGNVIFADQSNHRIRMVDLSAGEVSTVAGLGNAGNGFMDGPINVATFLSPSDVAVTTLGHIVVADLANARIRKIVP